MRYKRRPAPTVHRLGIKFNTKFNITFSILIDIVIGFSLPHTKQLLNFHNGCHPIH